MLLIRVFILRNFELKFNWHWKSDDGQGLCEFTIHIRNDENEFDSCILFDSICDGEEKAEKTVHEHEHNDSKSKSKWVFVKMSNRFLSPSLFLVSTTRQSNMLSNDPDDIITSYEHSPSSTKWMVKLVAAFIGAIGILCDWLQFNYHLPQVHVATMYSYSHLNCSMAEQNDFGRWCWIRHSPRCWLLHDSRTSDNIFVGEQ